MSAPILEWQMVTTHPDQLARFYGDLFGWTIQTNNALGYRQVDTGESSLHGGLWPAPPNAHSFVQLFVGVQAGATGTSTVFWRDTMRVQVTVSS